MDITDKLKYFRDNMVKFFKINPVGKYYKVIGWANQYSPILDVTARVKEVIPTVKKAILTIYGDNIYKISFEESPNPFPERSPEEIVEGWIQGYEEERQKSPDGLYALVRFPAKLEIQGGLPDTFSIKWRGVKPQVYKSHPWIPVGDAFITIGYDPIKNVIMNNLQMKDCDNYRGKILMKINGKQYDITNKAFKINTNKNLEVEFYLHYWRPGYQHTQRIKKIKINSNNKSFSIEKTNLPEYWGYVLEAWGYKPWIVRYGFPQYLLKYYDISKSKQISVHEPYDVDLPGNLSFEQRKAIKEVFGYDMFYFNNNPHNPTSGYWIGLWPKSQKTCTIYDFIHSYINAMKQIAKIEENKVIIDVTDIVKQVYPNTTKATLTVFIDPRKITISAPYNNKPPAFAPEEIVKHWENGQEWVRMYCSKNQKWYYVIFPCKLEIEKPSTPTTTPTPTLTTTTQTSQPTALIIAGIPIALLIIKKLKNGEAYANTQQ